MSLPAITTGGARSAAGDTQQEIEAAAASVLQLRRARLAKLLEQERLEYARELRAMGLALNPQDYSV